SSSIRSSATIRFSRRSFSLPKSSSASRRSSASSRPRGRVPLIGRHSTRPLRSWKKRSGEALTSVRSPLVAKTAKGAGVSARSRAAGRRQPVGEVGLLHLARLHAPKDSAPRLHVGRGAQVGGEGPGGRRARRGEGGVAQPAAHHLGSFARAARPRGARLGKAGGDEIGAVTDVVPGDRPVVKAEAEVRARAAGPVVIDPPDRTPLERGKPFARGLGVRAHPCAQLVGIV